MTRSTDAAFNRDPCFCYGRPKALDELPFDAHTLIAVVAPRLLFISAGNLKDDGWVDPYGSFIAAEPASPAYRLLGVRGLVGTTRPQIDETRPAGCIAYGEHEEGHTTGPNWTRISRFRSAGLEQGLLSIISVPKARGCLCEGSQLASGAALVPRFRN